VLNKNDEDSKEEIRNAETENEEYECEDSSEENGYFEEEEEEEEMGIMEMEEEEYYGLLCRSFVFTKGKCPLWHNCPFVHINIDQLHELTKKTYCDIQQHLSEPTGLSCPYAHTPNELILPLEFIKAIWPDASDEVS
jgi:hypothetical protein